MTVPTGTVERESRKLASVIVTATGVAVAGAAGAGLEATTHGSRTASDVIFRITACESGS